LRFVDAAGVYLRCCLAWFFFWYWARSMSYGKLRPGTARLRPIEWLLHVKLRAQYPPFGSDTPHCLSTSTGPFGFAPFCLGSSFFFFFAFGAFSASTSSFLFLPFFAPSPSTAAAPLIADLRALKPPSSSSPFSFLRAASLASLASFFFFNFSCFLFRQSRMCVAEEARRTGRRQCLHCTVSTLSSSGRPLGKPVIVFSSSGLTTGEVVAGADLFSTSNIILSQIHRFDRKGYSRVGHAGRHTGRFALLPVSSNRRLRNRLPDLQRNLLFLGTHRFFDSARV